MNAPFVEFVGLVPHAPILVPAIAGERVAAVRGTLDAMTALGRRVVASRPEVVVILSPHSPYRRNAAGLWWEEPLRASFAEFGAPEETLQLPLDSVFGAELERQAAARAVRTWRITAGRLDHGAAVPLHSLTRVGWRGPTIVLGIAGLDHDTLAPLGRAIAATAAALGRHIVIVASGDMSHRLTDSAPYGYHPAGPRFDTTFIGLIKRGEGADIPELDEALCDAAAEDVVSPTTIAWAAVNYQKDGCRVLSYEGPFGVGYTVAVLFDPSAGGPSPAPATTAAERQ